VDNVELACGIPSLMQGMGLEDIATGIDSQYFRQPLGVFAAITPFNFPAMVPMWFLPHAIACGNTFIVKPSERVPLSQVKMFELLHEAGFPEGVVNLVHGAKDVVDAILDHPGIAGRVVRGQLAGGPLHLPARRGEGEARAGAGRRQELRARDAGRRPHARRAGLDRVVLRLRRRALPRELGGAGRGRGLRRDEDEAGRGGEAHPRRRRPRAGRDHGPGDHRRAPREGVGYIEKGIAEGATLALDGRGYKHPKQPEGYYLGPTIFTDVKPDMVIAREEIFGPVLCVMKAGSFDEAVEIVKKHELGNASSIFTSSGKYAREYRWRVEPSMLGVNIGVAAPMAFFPFGGAKGSFYGDLKAHGRDAIEFYTDKKVTITRWF
jgi:malonate-semialdehyde dehydrogenase (acetylating)/methylmalonate-semialdehyde dehydrogenase